MVEGVSLGGPSFSRLGEHTPHFWLLFSCNSDPLIHSWGLNSSYSSPSIMGEPLALHLGNTPTLLHTTSILPSRACHMSSGLFPNPMPLFLRPPFFMIGGAYLIGSIALTASPSERDPLTHVIGDFKPSSTTTSRGITHFQLDGLSF